MFTRFVKALHIESFPRAAAEREPAEGELAVAVDALAKSIDSGMLDQSFTPVERLNFLKQTGAEFVDDFQKRWGASPEAAYKLFEETARVCFNKGDAATLSTPAEIKEEQRRTKAQRRRASLAQAVQVQHRARALHPDAQAILNRPLEDFMSDDDDDDDDNFDKLFRKGATDMDFSKINKAGVLELMNIAAMQIRKAEPKLTKEQAFTRYVDTPAGADMYSIYKRVPAQNVVPLHQPIRKIATASATAELQAKGEEQRKREPRLTSAQAFARVATDPANREIFKRAKAEDPYEPLEAA